MPKKSKSMEIIQSLNKTECAMLKVLKVEPATGGILAWKVRPGKHPNWIYQYLRHMAEMDLLIQKEERGVYSLTNAGRAVAQKLAA